MAEQIPLGDGFLDRRISNPPMAVGPPGGGIMPGLLGVWNQSPQQINPDNPAQPTMAWVLMSQQWREIELCLGGNDLIRQNARWLIPKLGKEKDPCYARRLQHVLYSPYLQRILNAAIGLILRKPIQMEGGNDDWWDEWRENVDRQGTDLEQYARRLLQNALAFGHCGSLCDAPTADGVQTLGDQYEQDLKPYLQIIEPRRIIGWREDIRATGSVVQQVRIREHTTQPVGKFGTDTIEQIRVLEEGKFEVYRRRSSERMQELQQQAISDGFGIEVVGDWEVHEKGALDLSGIPLSAVYSGKMGTFLSKPQLRDVAFINLQHCRLQSKLLHALDVAGFPLLTLVGWDDNGNSIDADVTSAIALPIGGSANYIEPASSSFAAQQDELRSLEEQMANLGIAILAQQKMVGETAAAKELDRADTNSLMAVVSMSLQQCLQEQINYVAEYAGQEAPEVSLDRNFSSQTLEHKLADITTMFTAGLIDRELALDLLKRGEVLEGSDSIDEILGRLDEQDAQDLQQSMDIAAGQAQPPQPGQPQPQQVPPVSSGA
jgi:hypothetical protein